MHNIEIRFEADTIEEMLKKLKNAIEAMEKNLPEAAEAIEKEMKDSGESKECEDECCDCEECIEAIGTELGKVAGVIGMCVENFKMIPQCLVDYYNGVLEACLDDLEDEEE